MKRRLRTNSAFSKTETYDSFLMGGNGLANIANDEIYGQCSVIISVYKRVRSQLPFELEKYYRRLAHQHDPMHHQ